LTNDRFAQLRTIIQFLQTTVLHNYAQLYNFYKRPFGKIKHNYLILTNDRFAQLSTIVQF